MDIRGNYDRTFSPFETHSTSDKTRSNTTLPWGAGYVIIVGIFFYEIIMVPHCELNSLVTQSEWSLPVSQWRPPSPRGQLHSYPSKPSTQVALSRHGMLAHSSMSVIEESHHGDKPTLSVFQRIYPLSSETSYHQISWRDRHEHYYVALKFDKFHSNLRILYIYLATSRSREIRALN